MTDYKTAKEIYNDLPRALIPIFWSVLIIALIILAVTFRGAYSRHVVACEQNKQDEFFWDKCYPVPDTIIKIVYKDTCLEKVTNSKFPSNPTKSNINLQDANFHGPTQVGNGNTQNN